MLMLPPLPEGSSSDVGLNLAPPFREDHIEDGKDLGLGVGLELKTVRQHRLQERLLLFLGLSFFSAMRSGSTIFASMSNRAELASAGNAGDEVLGLMP